MSVTDQPLSLRRDADQPTAADDARRRTPDRFNLSRAYAGAAEPDVSGEQPLYLERAREPARSRGRLVAAAAAAVLMLLIGAGLVLGSSAPLAPAEGPEASPPAAAVEVAPVQPPEPAPVAEAAPAPAEISPATEAVEPPPVVAKVEEAPPPKAAPPKKPAPPKKAATAKAPAPKPAAEPSLDLDALARSLQ